MDEIFSGLSRGVPGLDARGMKAPMGSFEEPEDIAAAQTLCYSPDKMFLGIVGARIERDTNTGERFAQGGTEIGVADDRHVITVAGSRAGKGRAAIIPNMLRYTGSVLAIDPKGELALETASVRAGKIGQRVCVVDPFGTTGGKLVDFYSGFNPVAMMHPDSMIEDAVLIADALIIPGEGDQHWDESARTFLEGVILEVFTADRFEGMRDLVTVRNLIAQGESLEHPETGETVSGLEVLEAFMRESEHAAIQRAASDFFDRPDRERDSVLSTTRRHLRPLSFPEIESSLQGEGFDLSGVHTRSVQI